MSGTRGTRRSASPWAGRVMLAGSMLVGSLVGSAVLVAAGPTPAGATGSCPTVSSDGTVSPPPAPGVDWDGCDLTDGGTVAAQLSDADLSGADLAGADLADADLAGADLDHVNGNGTNLESSTVSDADLVDADFTGAQFGPASIGAPGATMAGIDIDGASFASAGFYGVSSGDVTGTPVSFPASFALIDGYLVGAFADLEGASFAGDSLTGDDFQSTDLTDADLADADMTDIDLNGANLDGADLTDATLVGASAGNVTMEGTDLSGADATDSRIDGQLAGAQMGTTDLQGATVNSSDGAPATIPPDWFIESEGFLVGPGANLSGLNFIGDSFANRDLEGIDFAGSGFFNADLSGSDLTGADLSGAILGATVVISGHRVNGPANLSGADLTDTDLNLAALADAELTGVVSSGIVGVPNSLPVYWGLYQGSLRTASVLCAKVIGQASGTVTFKSCRPSSAPNARAEVSGGILGSGGTLTWQPSGGTTVASWSSSSPGRGKCTHGTELVLSGPVTGGTSTYTGADDWLSMTLCERKHGAVSLVPKTDAGL